MSNNDYMFIIFNILQKKESKGLIIIHVEFIILSHY